MVCFAEPLEVDDLPLTQESDGIADIRVIAQTQDVVVGYAGLLLRRQVLSEISDHIPSHLHGGGAPGCTGGGGGGSTGNNAVMQVSNTSGWLSKTIAAGKELQISFYWESIEDGLATGPGFVRVQVNGVVKSITAINQGNQTINVHDYLVTGSNVIKLNIQDSYENSRTINFSVNVIDLSLTSTFDASQVFTGNIQFPYTPVGAAAKTVHIILDGKEIKTVQTSSSGRQLTYMIPSQAHGAHVLKVYFDATVNGETITSNELYYEIICVNTLRQQSLHPALMPWKNRSTGRY